MSLYDLMTNMIAKRLAIPFVIWILIVLIQTYVYEIYGVGGWIIPPVIILTALFVFSPQIDWWWYNRFPPVLDEKIKAYLHRSSSFYRSLNQDLKLEFEKRIFFYMTGNDFSAIKMDTIPEDMKAAVAIYPITMTFGQKNFMLAPFERIVLYQHPFPSPNMKFLHASETDSEDGVILFSFEQLLQSQLRPDLFMNLGFYEYAIVYAYVHKKKQAPELDNSHWELLEKISNYSKDAVSKFTGFEEPSLFASLSSAFFTNFVKFRKEDSLLYDTFAKYFELDPVRMLDPSDG